MAQGWDPGVQPPPTSALAPTISAHARMTSPRACARECVDENAIRATGGSSDFEKFSKQTKTRKFEGHGTALTTLSWAIVDRLPRGHLKIERAIQDGKMASGRAHVRERWIESTTAKPAGRRSERGRETHARAVHQTDPPG